MEEMKDVILLDENGEEARFEHILSFEYEGGRYVALTPASEDEDEEAEVVILRVERDGKEEKYVTIDNEVLLDEVFNEFLDIINEMDGADEDGE